MNRMTLIVLLLLIFLGEMPSGAQTILKYKDQAPIPSIDTIVYVKFQFEVPLEGNPLAKKSILLGEYPMFIPRKPQNLSADDQKNQEETLENIHKVIQELLLKDPLSAIKFASLESMLFQFYKDYNAFAVTIEIKGSFIQDYLFLKRYFRIFSPSIARGEHIETYCKAYSCRIEYGQLDEFYLSLLLDHTEFELLRNSVLEKIKADLSISPGEPINPGTDLKDYQFNLSNNFYIEKGKMSFFYETGVIIEGLDYVCEITHPELAQLLGENHPLVKLIQPDW